MRNVQRYAVLVAVALLAACGSDKKSGTGPDGGEVLGNFTATLGGDITGSLAGASAFASANTGESQGFVFAMQDTIANSTASAAIIFVRQNPARPGTGTHQVVSFDNNEVIDDFGLLAVVTDAQGGEWICTATAGTINISSSAAQRIRGSFSVASECTGGGSQTTKAMQLNGNFDSRLGQVPGGVE